MTSAPVGFHCPNCVAAATAAVASSRGAVSASRADAKPYVSWTLVGFTVAVFLIQNIVGFNDVIRAYAMQPLAIGVQDEWYRLLTSMFLHGSILHILFNMYVLVVLGPTLERILGHGRFLLLFILSGLGGSIASYWLSAPTTFSVGASGAIFGLMGALLVAGRRLRFDVTMVLILIGINLAIGFIFSGIDWRAHLGGLVTGAALAAVMVLPDGKSRRSVEVFGTVGVVIVLFVVLTLRTAQITSFL